MPHQDLQLAILMQSAKGLGTLLMARAYQPSVKITMRSEDVRRRASSDLPDVVTSGDFRNLSALGDACWLPWLVHLTIGDVTAESWERFREWLSTHTFDHRTANVWAYLARNVSPVASLIDADWDYSDLSGLAETAATLAGVAGIQEWLKRLRYVQVQLGWLGASETRKLVVFGPGVLAPKTRDRVLAVLDTQFDSRLQPVVLDWLNTPRQGSRLTTEEFDRLFEWFGSLSPNSPWRRRSLLIRVASRAASLGRLRSTQFQAYIPELARFVLQNIAVDVALQADDEDLRFLLSQLGLSEYPATNERYGLRVPSAKMRKTILRFLPFVEDNDTHVHNAALDLIIAICLMVGRYEGPHSAIRSRQLDSVHDRLITSKDQLERAAGIALYTVRPPRSRNDWTKVQNLLKSATSSEVDDYWSWVLPSSAELATDPSLWAKFITSVLQDGAEEELMLILTDVLRKVLPRESQSLFVATKELSLPVVET